MSWTDNFITRWFNNGLTWMITGGHPIVHYGINFIPEDRSMYSKQQVCYFMNEDEAKTYLNLVSYKHENHTHERTYMLYDCVQKQMADVDLNNVHGKFEMCVEYTLPK